MKWFKIRKPRRVTKRSRYGDYRPELRREGRQQCVYCAATEPQLGGARMFHIEHYRPKSKFPELEVEYRNLFYVCAVCNVFKGNDWPREPELDHSVPAYPPPAQTDYSHLFRVTWTEGTVEGQNVAGRYVVTRLHLNRPHLIMLRRRVVLQARLRELVEWFEGVDVSDVAKLEDGPVLLQQVLTQVSHIALTLLRLARATPYEPEDLR